MNQKNNFDIWAYIAWYANVLIFVFIIFFLVFSAVVDEMQFELLANYHSKENWEFVFEKIIKLLFIGFTISLFILWIFSWKYLVDKWKSRTASQNKFRIVLMIFIPLVGSHFLFLEHRKSIKDK